MRNKPEVQQRSWAAGDLNGSFPDIYAFKGRTAIRYGWWLHWQGC